MADLASYALVSAVEAQDYINLSGKTAVDLTIELINYCSDAVRKYCGRDFIKTEHTELIDGRGRNSIYLKHWPILDSTDDGTISDPAVYLDYNRDDTWEAISTYNMTAKWTMTKTHGEIYLNEANLFPLGKKNIKVIYTAGYLNAAAVPGSLKLAVMKLMAWYKAETEKNKHGVRSITISGESVGYDFTTWPKDVIRVLESERRVII